MRMAKTRARLNMAEKWEMRAMEPNDSFWALSLHPSKPEGPGAPRWHCRVPSGSGLVGEPQSAGKCKSASALLMLYMVLSRLFAGFWLIRQLFDIRCFPELVLEGFSGLDLARSSALRLQVTTGNARAEVLKVAVVDNQTVKSGQDLVATTSGAALSLFWSFFIVRSVLIPDLSTLRLRGVAAS